MLGKLSIRNAKRQAKDYVIYFITVIISVALMFSFNSIAVSKDIIELSTYMEHFSKAITGVSIIIIFVMAWLINYTMKFMLEKRSKEFGTYQILGIEKKDISKMFTLENLVIGVVAFVVGIFAGTFLYQVFSSIIMNLFNEAINAYIKIRPKLDKSNKDYNALFLSSRGKRISKRSVQNIIKSELVELVEAEGKESKKYHTHTLRHTGATLLYNEANANIFVLKIILGHESLDATQVYTHVSDKKLKELMQNFNILDRKE